MSTVEFADAAAQHGDPWSAVVGQPNVVRSLRAATANPVHAYLFLGPAGTGKKVAASVFAGELLAAADPANAGRHRSLASRLVHPDVKIISPTGSVFRIEESKRLVTEASRSPVEGNRKVVIAERFHDANATAMPVLLKIAEEPPDSTIFMFLADYLQPEQVTVASRCTSIEFKAVADDRIVDTLVAEAVDPDTARRAAEAAGGSLERARLLVSDRQLMARRDAWWSIPDRLDGSGAAIGVIVEEIRSMIDDSMTTLKDAQKGELESLDEQEKSHGTRGSGRSELEAHHKRVARRHRTDELVFGFATLARRYRKMLVDPGPVDTNRIADAIRRLNESSASLVRSPTESLLLTALLLDLPAS